MKELALYEKRLAQALCCPPALRKRLLTNTREIAQDFLAGKPDATWDEIEEFLGDPQELAKIMLETEDQGALARYRMRRRNIRWGATGLAMVLFVTAIFFSVVIYMTRKIPVNVTIEETLVIYETEESEEDVSPQSP